MNPREAFLSAAGNLAAHKLRSALTMLGMIFGVGAVIAMLSIGAGAEQQALGTIERLGLRNVLVRTRDLPEQEAKEVRQKSLGVSARDAAAIADRVLLPLQPSLFDIQATHAFVQELRAHRREEIARMLGGERFYTPTVLSGVTREMLCARDLIEVRVVADPRRPNEKAYSAVKGGRLRFLLGAVMSALEQQAQR